MENRIYTVSELVHNPSFCRMVQGTANPGEVGYWSRWMEASDQNREKAKKAIAQITGFELADLSEVSELDFEKEWSRLHRVTIGKSSLSQQSFYTARGTFRWVYRVAAIFLLGSMIGLGIWLYSQNARPDVPSGQVASHETIITPDGQQKTLAFSNGAKIVMNSNTTLTYSIGQGRDRTIRVNLTKGGAFFSDHNTGSQGNKGRHIFTVTTPDGLVEDIGTEFVVTIDKNASRIILQNGHVRIETANGEKPDKGYDMKKGEMVTLRKEHILKKETVNPTFYTAWATGFIQFDHTPVRKFTRYVEKRFGIKVVIADPDLADVTMDGAVYFRSLEDLVQSASAATQVPVYLSEDRDTVYIGNPDNSKNRIKQ